LQVQYKVKEVENPRLSEAHTWRTGNWERYLRLIPGPNNWKSCMTGPANNSLPLGFQCSERGTCRHGSSWEHPTRLLQLFDKGVGAWACLISCRLCIQGSVRMHEKEATGRCSKTHAVLYISKRNRQKLLLHHLIGYVPMSSARSRLVSQLRQLFNITLSARTIFKVHQFNAIRTTPRSLDSASLDTHGIVQERHPTSPQHLFLFTPQFSDGCFETVCCHHRFWMGLDPLSHLLRK
jgi:hypothetical protein